MLTIEISSESGFCHYSQIKNIFDSILFLLDDNSSWESMKCLFNDVNIWILTTLSQDILCDQFIEDASVSHLILMYFSLQCNLYPSKLIDVLVVVPLVQTALPISGLGLYPSVSSVSLASNEFSALEGVAIPTGRTYFR